VSGALVRTGLTQERPGIWTVAIAMASAALECSVESRASEMDARTDKPLREGTMSASSIPACYGRRSCVRHAPRNSVRRNQDAMSHVLLWSFSIVQGALEGRRSADLQKLRAPDEGSPTDVPSNLVWLLRFVGSRCTPVGDCARQFPCRRSGEPRYLDPRRIGSPRRGRWFSPWNSGR
jgi:hypothetical protein